MPRKQPFSGKAKKKQLQEKRERHRRRDAGSSGEEEKEGAISQQHDLLPPSPVKSARGLTSVFEKESAETILERKQDAFRALVFAADRGNSQMIAAAGIDSVENQPPILVKPEWSREMTPEQWDAAEGRAYQAWIAEVDAAQQRTGRKCNLFERNIDVWRELWRTIERSDVLVHLADMRCPALHLSRPLIDYICSLPGKRVVLVLTKADLVPPERVQQWEAYLKAQYDAAIPVVAFNRDNEHDSIARLMRAVGQAAQAINFAERAVVRSEDRETLTVGFVGEPNVGKSSLLNSILQKHLVSVSATPGRTKHLQTHYCEHVEPWGVADPFRKVQLCDCPGIVFPRLNVPVSLQIVFGSFPIAQVREPFSAVRFIAENCVPHLHEMYKLEPDEDNEEWTPYSLCEAYAKKRGFHIKGGKLDVHRTANLLLRDTLNGLKIALSFPPPSQPHLAIATHMDQVHVE